MHPSIRKFPSIQFYDDKIKDHDSIIKRELKGTMAKMNKLFQTRLLFIDMHDSLESSDDKSRLNINEAEFTKQLIDYIAYNCTSTGTLK